MRKVLALHFFGCGYLSVQAKFSAQNHRLLDKEPCLTAAVGATSNLISLITDPEPARKNYDRVKTRRFLGPSSAPIRGTP